MPGRKVLICAGLVLAGAASAVLAETMYARTSAQVRAEKSLSSGVVVGLEQGDAVEVLDKADRHYRVRVGNKEGWVYYNKLSEERPEDVATLLSAGARTGGVQLTEVEAGGALRGLAPVAKLYALDVEAPDWAVQAVDNMQRLQFSQKELDDFAREGHLGEYAEVK